MAENLHVDLPRVQERDRLLDALVQSGYEARAVEDEGWPAIEVPCAGDSDGACDELMTELESLVGELAVPLVPTRGEGVIYLRPPAG